MTWLDRDRTPALFAVATSVTSSVQQMHEALDRVDIDLVRCRTATTTRVRSPTTSNERWTEGTTPWEESSSPAKCTSFALI